MTYLHIPGRYRRARDAIPLGGKPPLLAHKASHEARVAVEAIAGQESVA